MDTTELLAEKSWASYGGTPNPGMCGETVEDERTHYSYQVYADPDPSGDVQADAQTLADHQESLGMDTRIVDHGNFLTVYATCGPVARASFSTKDPGCEGYCVGVTSNCTPGNARDLEAQEHEDRENRVVIPGDDRSLNNS